MNFNKNPQLNFSRLDSGINLSGIFRIYSRYCMCHRLPQYWTNRQNWGGGGDSGKGSDHFIVSQKGRKKSLNQYSDVISARIQLGHNKHDLVLESRIYGGFKEKRGLQEFAIVSIIFNLKKNLKQIRQNAKIL